MMPEMHEEKFQVPNTIRVVVRAEQGRIGLIEGTDFGAVERAAAPENGVVEVIDGGLVVFTAHDRGEVDFRVQVLPHAPNNAMVGAFEDVVEVSYRARAGSASVVTLASSQPEARDVSFPEPGAVRARIHKVVWENPSVLAENYVVQLWQAPEAPEQVLRTKAGVATDRTASPERDYIWIEDSALPQAGCLTFASGATTEEVLDAFSADPNDSAAWSDRHDSFPDLKPFISLIPVVGGVVAVEDNGRTGTEPSLLQTLSTSGRRVASVFWNVNALRRLSFVRDSVILASAEWGLEAIPADLDPEVSDAVAGINYEDVHDSTAKDVLAATRFTRLTLDPSDLDALEATGRAYRLRQRTTNS